MKFEKVFIACDHAGFLLKEHLKKKFMSVNWTDLGTDSEDSVDYPDFAAKLADRVAADENSMGVLICGSGEGMCMSANRNSRIRAALCWNEESAKVSRAHNDANVICLSARLVSQAECEKILARFMESEFEGGRHARRVEKMSAIGSPKSHQGVASDPEIAGLIHDELERQQLGLEMIASENYTSLAVMQAQGSVLTNKYVEGLPGKRYYGGCEVVDQVERLAQERAKQLFHAEHVNVQPHSGSQANMAVLLAAAQAGDTIMGMSLSNGGHLTHGSPVNFSGFLFKSESYSVHPETGLLDYDQIRDQAKKIRPKVLIAGYSAYPRLLDFAKFREIANEVGATLLVDMAHFAGLVAGEVLESPIPFADYVTSTTHKTLRGPRGGVVFCREEYAKTLNSRIFPGIQGGPLEHVIAAKAVAFGEALRPEFKAYAKQIVLNAKALAVGLLEQGFDLVTGGTDNHLLLVDLTGQNISGKEAEEWLGQARITVNKNTVPNEKRSPFVTSGIRIGTPALTTRGFKESEMKQIAIWISQVLKSKGDETVSKRVGSEIVALCRNFPIY